MFCLDWIEVVLSLFILFRSSTNFENNKACVEILNLSLTWKILLRPNEP